jgi:SAM-dependent methyltransferase
MGTSSWNLDVICNLYDEGHFRMPAAIADIGCMQLSQATNESVRKFSTHFGKTPDLQMLASFDHYSYMGDLYRAAGFEYVSLDIVDAPYVFRFDLNNDQVPPSLKGKYDIVMNTGTTEHVLNQFNALKAIHDLAKPGGLIFSLFLINGFRGHGLLRYSNRFVELLAGANKYELIFAEIHARTFSQWRQEVGSDANPDEFVIDQCEWAVLRKTDDAPFSPVVDIDSFQADPDILFSNPERLSGRPDVKALMAEQKRLVRERDVIISKKDVLISEKDVLISEKDALISKKDALISEKDALISEKDALFSKKDALISEKDALISKKDVLISEKDVLISEKDTRLSGHKRWLAESNARLDAMRNSRSWRMTAPLRKAAGWLRNGVG